MEAMQRYLASYSDEIHADEANIILVDLYDDLAYAQTKEEGTLTRQILDSVSRWEIFE